MFQISKMHLHYFFYSLQKNANIHYLVCLIDPNVAIQVYIIDIKHLFYISISLQEVEVKKQSHEK